MHRIARVGVIGAGTMGSAIAAQLANAGLEVLLLDLLPPGASPPGGPDARRARNRLARAGLETVRRARPPALYLPDFSRHITAGNVVDDAARLATCDWVIEAVTEQLEVKRRVLAERVLPHWRPGIIVSSATSGLSVHALGEGLPADARRHFLLTHFFNPPRYMQLVEVVPGRWTDPTLTRAIAAFIAARLGKGVVVAKDTPGFIANRISLFAVLHAMWHMEAAGLSIPEVDAVCGPPTARSRSAYFRTSDLVGLDTVARLARDTHARLPHDESRDTFLLPPILERLIAAGRLGDKSGGGFYQRPRNGHLGPPRCFDPASGQYVTPPEIASPAVQRARLLDDPAERLRTVLRGDDPAARFGWLNLRDTLLYASRRVPEIADDVPAVDNAMKWGFHWELGPFEMLDAIGADEFRRRCREDGLDVPDGLAAAERFYRIEAGRRLYYDMAGRSWREAPRRPDGIDLELLRSAGGEVERGTDASMLDLGDGVFLVALHPRHHRLGAGVLDMIRRGLARAETEGAAMVISGEGRAFSAGADLAPLTAAIATGDFGQVERLVRDHQDTAMALKYSRVPVVAAPHGSTLGPGCELCLHAAAVVAQAETHMGLDPLRLGLTPAGGGVKELCLRAVELGRVHGVDPRPILLKEFLTLLGGRVSASAHELFELGYLRPGDSVTLDPDRLVADAKTRALALARNFHPGRPGAEIPAPGRDVAATLIVHVHNLVLSGRLAEHQAAAARALAGVITGGDVCPGTPVTENRLLELEREAFLNLCGRPDILDRLTGAAGRPAPPRRSLEEITRS